MKNAKESPLINRVQEILKANECEFELHKMEDEDLELALDRILCPLGEDADENPYWLDISSPKQLADELELDPDSTDFLVFTIPLNFIECEEIEDPGRILEAIMRLNTHVPLGSFQYNFEEKFLLMQYQFVTTRASLKDTLLMEILMMMRFFAISMGASLNRVAQGKCDPSEVILDWTNAQEDSDQDA